MTEQYLDLVDKINCRSQILRAHYFEPVLKFLTKYKITANQVTNFRLILGIISILLYLLFYRYYWAIDVLLLGIILDILDGALARHQKKFNDRGKFLDIFVDHVLYCIMLFFVLFIVGNRNQVFYHLFIIPIVYLLAIIKKQEFLPSDWIIKSYPRVTIVKLLVFIAFYGHWFFNFGLIWLDRSILISNVLATILSIYYFIYIQLRWKKYYK